MRTETTFANFSKKKKLNSSQYCRMSYLLSSLPRKKKGNCFVYDETDLERLYQKMPLLKKAPDGYITAITFFQKYKEFEPYRGSIITYMSNLALQGLIKREPLNKTETRFAYLEADFLTYAKKYKEDKCFRAISCKNESQHELPLSVEPTLSSIQPKTKEKHIIYQHGVFVRIWRWLFGYRKEVQE